MRCTRHRAQTEIRPRGSQRPYFNSWHQTPSLRCCGDRYPNLLQSELAVSLILPEALGREWCVRYLLTSPASPAGVVGAALRTPRPRLASRSRTRRRCAPDRTSSGARHRARPSSAPCRCSPARTVPRTQRPRSQARSYSSHSAGYHGARCGTCRGLSMHSARPRLKSGERGGAIGRGAGGAAASSQMHARQEGGVHARRREGCTHSRREGYTHREGRGACTSGEVCVCVCACVRVCARVSWVRNVRG